MAEVVALSSSIVSFVALAGQVLHGCRFLVEFLDDVVDAPDDLACLVAEVEGFRSAILTFQGVLQQVHPAVNIQPVEEQINISAKKKRWKALTLARRKAKFAKYLDRLARAKVDISLAQASTNLILTISHQWKMERLSQSMSALNTHVIPGNPMLADELSASEKVHDFYTRDRAMSSSHLMDQRNQRACHPTSDIPRITSRQTIFTQTFYLWLATITICSVITTIQEPLAGISDKISDESDEITTNQTSFDVRCHPWITKYCLLAILEKTCLRFSRPHADLRFRVYTYVSWDSQIAEACRTGDLTSADRLFREGRASPHDIVVRKTPPGGLTSLTDLVWEYWLDLGIRLNNSEANDDKMEPSLQTLGRLFNMFHFLVDSGHNSSRLFRWDNMMVCQLWILFHKEWSKHPPLISYIEDMTQLLMNKVASMVSLSIELRQDLSVARKSLLVVPSLASQPKLAAWSTPEGQSMTMLEVPKEFPHMYMNHVFHAYTSGTASLILDPEALYLSAPLQYASPELRNKVLVDICGMAERQSRQLFKEGKGSWDSAVKRRLASCLNRGMDPRTKKAIAYGFARSPAIQSYKSAEESTESLIQYFISAGKADLLRSAMLHVGRDPDEIATLFEEEACASIVQELDQLKPSFYLSEVQRHLRHKWSPTCPDSVERGCRYYINLALNAGYRKYFPEEDERTMELIREIESENEGVHEEETAPAINGLTEDFWD